MEADWAAEIGPRLDRICMDWPGFIDLRADPGAIGGIAEAAPGSALHAALAALNAPESPVLTCKCDRWAVPAEELDPYELEASRETARVGGPAMWTLWRGIRSCLPPSTATKRGRARRCCACARCRSPGDAPIW